MIGLYVHIPFCTVKCRFCHFAVYPGLTKEIPNYLSALKKEMSLHSGRTLDTVYFGGGTPTVLEPADWKGLTETLHSVFKLAGTCEITVECNPENTTREKLSALKECGATRLSFGLQATQDAILTRIGRTHDFEKFKTIYAAARGLGFNNLNIDLIYGLPDQTASDWESTLESIVELAPEHVSAYALDVEERSAFHHLNVQVDEDLQAEMYEILSDRLEFEGFNHYEISNFARPGFECRHNLKYWKNQPCLGVGVSAASYENGVRRTNVSRIEDYLKALSGARAPIAEEVTLSDEKREGENLILALRLKEGSALSLHSWERYGPILEKFASQGLVNFDGERARLTRAGWLLSDRVFRELV
jgi:oxygen-independent coproporphyrinogen-3 oxidase